MALDTSSLLPNGRIWTMKDKILLIVWMIIATFLRLPCQYWTNKTSLLLSRFKNCRGSEWKKSWKRFRLAREPFHIVIRGFDDLYNNNSVSEVIRYWTTVYCLTEHRMGYLTQTEARISLRGMIFLDIPDILNAPSFMESFWDTSRHDRKSI